MSEAVAMHGQVEAYESPITPESWGKLGMWVFLAADAMSFGGLLAGYGALRYSSASWPSPKEHLGITLTALMTFLLICSSVTMVKGLSAVRRGDRRGGAFFLLLTILGGATFLGLQAFEWTHNIEHGMTIRGNPWGSSLFGTTFYILTGFHGMHVTAGVLYLAVVLVQVLREKIGFNEVEIAGLYWHFVDLIWILVFTFVYLI